MARLVLISCAALGLAGCAHRDVAAAPPRVTSSEWRQVATDADRDRLRDWRSAWMSALPAARSAAPTDIGDDPLFFSPDRRLDGALPPPGRYRCRTVKLGMGGTATRAFTAYPAYPCRIARRGGELFLSQKGGAQRPVGTIFADVSDRAVFLGTLMLGDEKRAFAYGRDTKRDMAGFVERIDKDRWRLELPFPTFQSTLGVIDITPDTGSEEAADR